MRLVCGGTISLFQRLYIDHLFSLSLFTLLPKILFAVAMKEFGLCMCVYVCGGGGGSNYVYRKPLSVQIDLLRVGVAP